MAQVLRGVDWTLHHGDCRRVLPGLDASSVDTIITDPPYHLTQQSRRGSARQPGASRFRRHRASQHGFMGETWDGGDIAFDIDFWKEVLRVAKPGAMLLAFGGTRTFHRLTCAVEDAGWEIRDCLMWLYGSGFPKSLNISKAIDRAAGAKRTVVRRERMKRMASPEELAGNGGMLNQPQIMHEHTEAATDLANQWDGWGTALKPAWEPIILAMKPPSGTFAQNAQKHGVAGISVDAGRIPFRNADNKNKATPRGRWPANVLLSHNPKCRRLGSALVKSRTHNPSKRAPGGTSTSGHRGQADLVEKNIAHELIDRWRCHPDCPVRVLDKQSGQRRAGGSLKGDEPSRPFKNCYGEMKGRRIWQSYADVGGASRFFYCAKASKSERKAGLRRGVENTHPSVKPLALMEYLCRLTATPTGGVVLDPFAGTGTTLLAALTVGRSCIGIEREKAYVRIAKQRLTAFRKKEAG